MTPPEVGVWLMSADPVDVMAALVTTAMCRGGLNGGQAFHDAAVAMQPYVTAQLDAERQVTELTDGGH